MELNQFIDNLDFNSYEKEVISFLAIVDNADANTIYKKTKVPQGRIYSVLNSLISKGLVNTIPTSPKKYKINELKESLKTYLESKKTDLNKKIEEIERLELKPKLFELKRNSPSVYTFTGKDEHLNALISLRNRSNKQILQIAPLFEGTFASNLSLYKAIKRGVKARIITKKITQKNKKNIKECLNLGAEIKCLDSPELVHFLIKDSEEFILGLEDYRNQEERLSIYSKNPGLLFALQNYFENLWSQARKIPDSALK